MHILPIAEVVKRIGVSRRTVYELLDDDAGFPRPIQLTRRRVGWVESELDDWIAARIAERDRRAV